MEEAPAETHTEAVARMGNGWRVEDARYPSLSPRVLGARAAAMACADSPVLAGGSAGGERGVADICGGGGGRG